ncbi:MAG: cytochrome c [Rhodobacterales bacterium]|nr:cytochrome c [Rhodobacterales bacterium]
MPLIRWALFLGVVTTGAGLWLTAPQRLPAAATAGLTGDAGRGAAVFHAAGCAGCHMAPGAEGAARLVLAGGQEFPSPFGTFVAPNISSDPVHGIGGWTLPMLADALVLGTSPEGAHYYPALPYASYEKADLQDIADLHAYLGTLPADPTPSLPHRIGFPFNIRATLGAWKALYTGRDWAVQGDLTAQETRGRYLAEALGHCGECHTPRDPLGGMDLSRWLAGAPNPSGQGTIPNITPAKLTWSAEEVAEYLTSGFTPDYDSAGGHMAHVVANLAQLPAEDRAAIAAYLQRVAPAE